VAGTRTWKRVLGYASAGVVVGYLLFVVTGVEKEIALLIACALLAGFVAFERLRERSRDHPYSTDTAQAGHGSYDDLLLERWKQDLDIAATGIRGPSVSSNESTGIGLDVVPIPPIEAGRD
jgi:predicted membrane-bound spermidine synthase